MPKPDVLRSTARRARRRLPLSMCVGAIVLAALMLPVVSLALAVAPSFTDYLAELRDPEEHALAQCPDSYREGETS